MKVEDPFGGRPKSLAEALAMIDEPGAFREFLDEFYSEQVPSAKYAMLTDEPRMTDDPKRNAWAAACAAHLSAETIGPVPEWARQNDRYLKRPWFPMGMDALKATFIVESPAAFRERMIFVEADPLYRPRRDVPFGTETFDDVSP